MVDVAASIRDKELFCPLLVDWFWCISFNKAVCRLTHKKIGTDKQLSEGLQEEIKATHS